MIALSTVQSSTQTLFTFLVMITHSAVQSFTRTQSTLLAMIALSTVQSSTQTFIHITSNDCPFNCPIIYTDIYSHY